MNAFNRILVGLDLTDMDQNLIDYLHLVSPQFPPPKTYFLHVSYRQQLPVLTSEGRYTREQPDEALMASLHQRYLHEMQVEVNRRIPAEQYEADFEVVEGTITRQMLHHAEQHEVDLTILGKKRLHLGSGVAAHRFLRSTHSSVMFITEEASHQMEHIVVATDFSTFSEQAVSRAVALARSLSQPPRITLIHIYDVPTDVAFRISRTQGQFAHIMRENVESVVPEYLARFDLEGLEVETQLIENTHYNTARHLQEYLQLHHPDLLVMGARGHSTLSAWLLGSVVEKMLRFNEQTPMLVVRKSGATWE
jgi:nucleotide-binding universal stress UspA family protein